MFPFDDSDSQTLTEHLLGIRRRPVERSTYSPLSIVVARPHQRKRATRARSTPTATAPAAPPSPPRRAPAPPAETPEQRAFRGGVERERAAFAELLALAEARGMRSSTAVELYIKHGVAGARAAIESVRPDAFDRDVAARLAGIESRSYAERQAEAESQRREREEPGRSAPTPTPAPELAPLRSLDDPPGATAIYRRRQAAMDDAADRRRAEHREVAPPAEAPSAPSPAPRTLAGIDASEVYQRREATMIATATARKREREE